MKKIPFALIFLVIVSNISFAQSGWYPVCSNFPYYALHFDFVNELTGFITCAGGKVLKTTNGGSIWNELNTGNGTASGFFTFINQDTGYFSSYQGLLFTTNQGNSFTTINTGIGSFTKILFLNNSIGYAIQYDTPGKLYKTTNAGFNWTLIYTYTFSINSHIDDFAIESTQNIFLSVTWSYQVAGQSIVKKSTDGGNNFFNIFSTDTTLFHKISFMNNLFFLTEPFFYKSTNNGLTWQANSSANLVEGNIVKSNSNNFFGGSRTGYGSKPILYNSKDFGNTWDTVYISNANEGGFESIKFINDSVGWALGNYIGSNGILLKTTTGGLTFVNQINSEIPKSLSLHQNYPNPFNPVTKIKFDLPVGNGRDRPVKIIIYDILGSEVTTIVNEQLKPGIYEAEWDGSNFASGIYFYSLVTDGFTETKKMLLIK